MVAPDGTLRTRYPGDQGEAVPLDVAAVLEGAGALLIDATAPADQLKAAELAKQKKLPVILDINEVRDGTSELISVADVFLGSERAASELAPRGELTDAVFHGAFAAALLSELPFARCMDLASAAASLSLRELGPWQSMPAREDVLKLVRARRA